MTTQPAATPPRKRTPRKPTADPAAAEQQPAPEPTSAPAMPGVPDVAAHVAWAAVMRDVEKITKDDRNTQQSFNFRGIDATMNSVGPVLRRHGVIVIPQAVELVESERYDAKNGTAMHGVITKHVWNVIGPRGDGFLMETLGQSADAGDKAIPKSSSVAYRTALLQSLTVPTGDRDPDADSHERVATDPRQEQWDRIAGLAKYARQTTESVRKHYLEKMGHEIDGADATVETLTSYADRLEAHLKEQAEKAAADQAGNDDPRAPTPDPAVEREPAAAEPSGPPPVEPALAKDPAQPEPQKPAQGRDPRQALWDEILQEAARLKMTADAVRAHFREWVLNDTGRPSEIDGPDTTHDLLTRYYHVLHKTAAEDTQ